MLNARQAIFCKEYILDFNATQAAIRAGYSKKTSYSLGQRLLKHVEIKAEIERLKAARDKRLDISADKVLQELAKMAFANMQDYMRFNSDGAMIDFSTLTRDQAAAIQEITVDEYVDRSYDEEGERVKKTKFKLCDKKSSLELLGKHLNIFSENLNINKNDLSDEEVISRYNRLKRNVKS